MVDVTIDAVLRAGDLGRIVEQHGRLYRAEYGSDERFEGYVAAGIVEAVRAGFVEMERRPPAAPWGGPVTEARWQRALDGR